MFLYIKCVQLHERYQNNFLKGTDKYTVFYEIVQKTCALVCQPP